MKFLYLLIIFITITLFFTPKRKIVLPIQEINQKKYSQNKWISFVCNELKVNFRQNIPISINGKIFYEDGRFRLIASSFFSKELDIGINNQKLWYWSKRSRPHAIYYSDISKLKNTKLKSALNPEWIVISLCLPKEIKNVTEKYEMVSGTMYLSKHENHIEDMIIATLVDRSTDEIKGNYLYSKNGKIVASSEVYSRQLINGISIPKKLHIIWYEEGIVMDWDLSGVSLNSTINQAAWIMPNIIPSIDIGK